LNPNVGLTEAVTLPLVILVAATTSSESAENGMFRNPLPSPTKIEPLSTYALPLIRTLPVICEPLVGDLTTNPYTSLTDAVTEPEAIKFDINASGVSAVLGISNNPNASAAPRQWTHLKAYVKSGKEAAGIPYSSQKEDKLLKAEAKCSKFKSETTFLLIFFITIL
jgi:hypothetical protein